MNTFQNGNTGVQRRFAINSQFDTFRRHGEHGIEGKKRLLHKDLALDFEQAVVWGADGHLIAEDYVYIDRDNIGESYQVQGNPQRQANLS